MGRRTNGSGSLKIRNGIYIAKWMYNGKMFERSTHIKTDMVDAKGKPCAKEMALAVLAGFTEPYRHKQEADVLAVIANRMKTERELGKRNPIDDMLRLENLATAYEESSRRNSVSQRHLNAYKAIIDEFALWCGKKTYASQVDESIAVKWADSIWKSGISATTFNSKICCMRVVWRTLKPLIGFSESPWDGIKKKKDGVHTRRPFAKEELVELYDAIGDRYGGDVRVMCKTGEHTGMRIGDCAMLKWEDINFDSNMIRVTTQKTGEKVNVPMHSELRASLLSHKTRLDEQYARAKEFGWREYWLSLPSTGYKGRETNVVDSRYVKYVVPRMAERYERDSTLLNAMMHKLIIKAGLESSRKEGQCIKARPVLGFHSFRHGLATKLAEAGVPQVIAMMLLGHRNANVHDAYRHVNDEFLKLEFAKLEERTS